MKKGKIEKEGFGAWITKKLDLPSGPLTVEMRGRRSLYISGCDEIIKYEPKNITVRVGREIIDIIGSRLECNTYYCGKIGVEGRVMQIIFKEDCRNEDK